MDVKISKVITIEPIEKGSRDYLAIKEVKSEKNPSYNINEAREKLGIRES
jgi:hypothetical protein